MVSQGKSNNNNKELEPFNNNSAVAELFFKTFSCRIPEDTLQNPNLKKAVDYMVEHKPPAEVNTPVGFLIKILRDPDSIPKPKPEPDPGGVEKHRAEQAQRRRKMEEATKEGEKQRKDPEQVKRIHELVAGIR